MIDSIVIRGARENNLKGIDVTIPKNKLVVLTGPSGSGKSSLAMETLERECQRQYMESMGMTIESIQKPKVDAMIGLSPSISINQHVTNRNPRSTVGTVTDIYTYLRLIYEKLGEQPCPSCGTRVPPPVENELHPDTPNHLACPRCGERLEKLTMSHFSFNTPEGACPTCDGMGVVNEIRQDLVFEEDRSLSDGCVKVWDHAYGEYLKGVFRAACRYYGLPLDERLPLKEYSEALRSLLFYGVESEEFCRHFPDKRPPKTVSGGKFEGVLTAIRRRFHEKGGNTPEAELFQSQPCPECLGLRLKKRSRDVLVTGTPITSLMTIPLEELQQWLHKLETSLEPGALQRVESFLQSLQTKVARIITLGLGYLSLDRQSITLSGGEAQRLKLASVIGSALTGVLYILDEPTAGLHPKDTKGLVATLKQLRDLGNTVLVIEHDVDVMFEADYIIDMGPGAGSLGGEVVGAGTLQELMEQPSSVTGRNLKERATASYRRRAGNGNRLTVHRARKHNLKDVTVSFPLGAFIAVTGVSGSGKSTLVFDVLGAAAEGQADGCDAITGLEQVSRIVQVGQAPLARMKRSNIATYTDIFTPIRNLYAALPEAKRRKVSAKEFSFNTPGGRCEHCQGMGTVNLMMHFLPELEVECPACRGRRFQERILTIKYKEYSISDILDLFIEESLPIFEEHPELAPNIQLLCDIGLGYLKWGQPLTTLSGGEGQRLKLARELKNPSRGHTLYLLDEPSTGLHPTEVTKLLVLLQRLVDAGNTVIVVEHNSEIVRACDWVIDLGPEGGSAGGNVVAEGTPEAIAATESSYTGRFL